MVWVLAIVLPLTAALISCLILCSFWIKKLVKGEVQIPEDEEAQCNNAVQCKAIAKRKAGYGGKHSSGFQVFPFSLVAFCTKNFADENILGQGGFGTVYKGLGTCGIQFAAKRLSAHSGQGLDEFRTEIKLIAELQHTNLVKLLGCAIDGEEKIVIYEYMQNKSLDYFIFDAIKGALLDWNKRLHITKGIAQGLLFLHMNSKGQIIHRDLKASNILLDNEMNAKISDFGMAKMFASNIAQANTQKIAGTFGYMAPEYATFGNFSVKSDVFSFGVLLLEIISGTRSSSFDNDNFFDILGYAWQLWKDGRSFEIIDPALGECDTITIVRCIKVALLCVQEKAADRPTMSDVVAMLSDDNTSLSDPQPPAYCKLNTNSSYTNSSELQSRNNVTITIVEGR